MVAAVRSVGDLEFVNRRRARGASSRRPAEAAVTEVAAGSGLYAPMLFKYYRTLALAPAAGYALPVSRKPAPGVATALGGGYVASGPVRTDRQPVPAYPAGLRLDPFEGAGEAQTPLLGRAAAQLRVGERVYLRHAKAGRAVRALQRLVSDRTRSEWSRRSPPIAARASAFSKAGRLAETRSTVSPATPGC